jgi:SAM-dependent methyltransferase
VGDTVASWRGSLFPRGERGFADDPYWYDLHVASEPRYGQALQEVVRAAPPQPPGTAVADLGAGTGALAQRYLSAYSLAELHLIDPNRPKLEAARARLGGRVTLYQQAVDPEQPAPIGVGGYRLLISGLTLHVIADWNRQPDEQIYAERNLSVMRQVFASLAVGGVFVYADFTRHGLGVREHLSLMESAGFAEVDCAWRSGDLTVVGGQRQA